MTIKIATFGDLHVGVTTYGYIDPKTGLNTRVLNALESLDQMVDYCIENNIKYLVGAGDMYKNNLPSPTLQREFNARIKRAAINGIAVYIMDGNHDVSPVETAKSALDPFETLGVDNVYHSRFTTIHNISDNLRLLMLPTYCNQTMVEQILEENQSDIPTIVVGHATILGAMLNDWLIEQNEDAIDSRIFEKPNILAVVLGHLHKYQVLNTWPLTYYTGSLQRIDFTEEFQEKGFVVLEVDPETKTVGHKFIEVPSQKFHTINLDLQNENDEMECVTKVLENAKHQITGSIFRLGLDVNKNNNINDGLLIKQIKEYKIKAIASIQKNIDRADSIRNKEITETITEEKALEMYFKDHDLKDEIVQIGLEMITKLKADNLI